MEDAWDAEVEHGDIALRDEDEMEEDIGGFDDER